MSNRYAKPVVWRRMPEPNVPVLMLPALDLSQLPGHDWRRDVAAKLERGERVDDFELNALMAAVGDVCIRDALLVFAHGPSPAHRSAALKMLSRVRTARDQTAKWQRRFEKHHVDRKTGEIEMVNDDARDWKPPATTPTPKLHLPE